MVKIILGVWGEDKSGKTTLALSAPKPLIYMEFDIGGFNRANKNLEKVKVREDLEAGLIIREKHPMPFQVGDLDPLKRTIRPSKSVVGMKELFFQWLANYIQHLDSDIASIVVDTTTLLWEVTCQGYLQEKQELQLDAKGNLKPNEKLRVQLQAPEYREPNTRMRGIVYQAQLREKNLILTHHATDEYGPVLQKDGSISEGKTGKRVRHGWAWLGDAADIIVHTYHKEKNGGFYCKVDLAGEPGLVGMEFKDPTFDDLNEVTRRMRGEP